MVQRNLLVCQVGAARIAVPLERVIGVVEGGPVTPLPFSAAAFEGLVEVFGQIVPQVGLAAMLGEPAAGGGILVVVSDRGGSLALRVEHVARMIQVDADAFTHAAARGRARHPLFNAELEHQDDVVAVLDLDLVGASEELELSATDEAVIVPDAEAQGSGADHAPREDLIALLRLEIAGGAYAVPNDAVSELHVPGAVRPMPGAPDWILGLIDLRGAPVVAVSTAALLGRPVGEAPPDTCLIAELADGFRIALFVDRAPGLERVSPRSIFAMAQTMAGVTGYFVLGDDEIVGVLDPRQLVAQVERSLRDAVPCMAIGEGEVASARAAHAPNEQLLALRVGRELYGMPLDRIARIESSVTLTPLPSHLAYFDGMADVGDAIVPVIDLRRQQGESLQPFDTSTRPPCILTVLEGAMTGLLVDQVLSIFDVAPERFESVRGAAKLPISHVVSHEGQLVAVLTLDRLLPAA